MIFSHYITADEAKISGERQKELDGLAEDEGLKEFGNGLQVLKVLRMVEQEQLSGMDLLMVQQHLHNLPCGVGAKSVQWEQENYALRERLLLEVLGMT
jgi:hypothetical protein